MHKRDGNTQGMKLATSYSTSSPGGEGYVLGLIFLSEPLYHFSIFFGHIK